MEGETEDGGRGMGTGQMAREARYGMDGVAAGSNLGLGARQLCRTRRCEGRRTRRMSTATRAARANQPRVGSRTLLHGSGCQLDRGGALGGRGLATRADRCN